MVVQDHDSVLDQLAWKREHLEERHLLAVVEQRLATEMERAHVVTNTRRELEGRQGALEAEAETAAIRIKSIEGRMYSGEVSASRDLQAMASEVKSLEAKRSDLDDQTLALLEELEPIEAELDVLAADRRPLEEEVANALAALGAAESVLDAEIQAERQARDSAASGLDPDLLARYEKLRQRLGGVGAARLVNGSCSGCHLAFSAAELNQIQRSPRDVVIICEQCGRILVH